MVAQYKLKYGAAGFQHLGGGGLYLKPFAYRQHAARLQLSAFCILNKAHAARADVVDVLKIAQSGDLDTFGHTGFKHSGVRLGLNRSSVDFECNHLSKPFLCFSGHVLLHAGYAHDIIRVL